MFNVKLYGDGDNGDKKAIINEKKRKNSGLKD